MAAALFLFSFVSVSAEVKLIAKDTLTGSAAGLNADLSGLKGNLENGVPANLLGGLGSGFEHVSGDTFLALPDRGPNAVKFNPLIDDTVSYIPRFHEIKMNLVPNSTVGGLPYTITPTLNGTTLLNSATPLVYGSGAGLNVGPGAPSQNTSSTYYFSGRSDNYDSVLNSGNAKNARLDPESIRMSPDGVSVFISDEYGPYVYQFRRSDGQLQHSYTLPDKFYVLNPKSTGDGESTSNTSGRTPNKGMEGLAITPDGKTLVGIMQSALLQDAALGRDAVKLLRIVKIDVATGQTYEYAYLLTTGSGVSEIVALNDHEFLVDERDGKGLGDGSKAAVKQIFKIDLAGAEDVSSLDGTQAATKAVGKSLFLDLVQVLTASGVAADQIPAKIEGLAFGDDVAPAQGSTQNLHTLWIANDNDFLQDYKAVKGGNPNQFYVFGFTDADLNGSQFVPAERNILPTHLAFGTSPATPIIAGGNTGPVSVQEERWDRTIITQASDMVTLQIRRPSGCTQTFSKAMVNGIAPFNLMSQPLKVAGDYLYTASTSGFPAISVSAVVNAAAPSSVIATSGTSQNAAVNTMFAAPLIVTVKDAVSFIETHS